MRTLIVSDLHLGSRGEIDLARRPELRDPLLEQLADVDRLVLLGDLIELRTGPVHQALKAARPCLRALGAAMAGREVVVVPGNHDHALLADFFAARQRDGQHGRLTLDGRLAPAAASGLAVAVAESFAGADCWFSYPGIWITPRVYATHGHYLDHHVTIPGFEHLALAAIARWPLASAARLPQPEAYEAVAAPLYSLFYELAQRPGGSSGAAEPGVSVRVWKRLQRDGRRRSAATIVLAGAVPLIVAALNRAGLGPLRSDISGEELRRGVLCAMGAVVTSLGVEADHVVFGHSHRSGPLPGDDLAEWRAPTGAALHNSGSWVYQRHFLTGGPAQSPYWPGCAIVVEDQAPPTLLRLLADRSKAQLRPPTVSSPGRE